MSILYMPFTFHKNCGLPLVALLTAEDVVWNVPRRGCLL
jgi:hypothetical protein